MQDAPPVAATYGPRLDALLEGRSGAHPSDVFRDVDDDFWFWMHTEGRDVSPALHDLLPGLPDDATQIKFTNKAGYATLTEGFAIYRTMRDLHNRNFGSLRDRGKVLDFGCGFGRVIRYFLKDVAPGQLIGCDVSGPLIDFCIESNPWCSFTHNDPIPPLPLEDNEVGFIYAYSVFSHLSEPMHRRWLEEFKRVLRPGGVLALTIRERGFIEYCKRVREDTSIEVAPLIRGMFADADAALERYDAGEFCFTPYDPAIPDAWWGEACIPRAYIEQRWSELFTVDDFVSGDLMQHLVLLHS
jgi:SAM-dependent methyltransferase